MSNNSKFQTIKPMTPILHITVDYARLELAHPEYQGEEETNKFEIN